MRTFIDAAVAPRSAVVLALSLAAFCGGRTELPLPPPRTLMTTVIAFEHLAVGTPVDRQFLAQGVEFVNGPLFEGIGAARLLPWVSDSGGGGTKSRLALIHPFRIGQPEYDSPNLMWGKLRFPTRRVKVRVRNFGERQVEVHLVVRDNQGVLHRDRLWLPADRNYVYSLEVKMDDPNLTEFVVFADRSVIGVEEVILDHYPR